MPQHQNGCRHHEIVIRDIGICHECSRVIQYNPYEQDPNTKPVILKEGHVPGLEYVQHGKDIDVYYEGKHWATMSMENAQMAHLTQRIVQSMAMCYLREGSLTIGRSIREQVQGLLEKGMNDEEIINRFPRDKRDTAKRYVRDLRRETNGREKHIASNRKV